MTNVLSKQAGRRYPQSQGCGGLVRYLPSRGTSEIDDSGYAILTIDGMSLDFTVTIRGMSLAGDYRINGMSLDGDMTIDGMELF